jgi:colanic acid biosynthesis glycosyl transferase WcaI
VVPETPLTICFFNRSYWPDVAATGQYLTELAQDLAARGCGVSVVAGAPLTVSATRRGWRLVERDEREGVRILRANGTRFSPRRFIGRVANYLTYFASAALASLSIGRHDVVVAMTDPPIVGLLALWTARRTGAKFIFLCEDIFPEVAVLVEGFDNRLVSRTLDRINRYLLARADAIVVLGPRMQRRLVEEKGADPSRMAIIHNWADCDAIQPAAKNNAFARAHGLADRFVVMHSGNVGLSQNLEVLLDAAEELRGRTDVVFAIVGDGSKRRVLEADARRRGLANVLFLPYQPKALLDQSFAAADVFLVSLKAGLEGYIVPSKIYGILAAGRPFIAAVDPSCEVAGIARESHCGLVAPAGDAGALASSVVALYDDRAELAAMGRRARDAAWAYDRRRAVSAYHDLFLQVAGLGHEARV